LDDFSQNLNENGEKDNKETGLTDSSTDDIQFEDSIDVEKLLKTLQENPDIQVPSLPDVAEQKPAVSVDKNAKKYVIYVNHDNIDFMESLSIAQRRDVINNVLKEQNEISIKKKEADAKKRYIFNWILGIITLIICFPIIFTLVNKSMEISIANYKQSKSNFSRLYKDKGKIQRQDLPSADKTGY